LKKFVKKIDEANQKTGPATVAGPVLID